MHVTRVAASDLLPQATTRRELEAARERRASVAPGRPWHSAYSSSQLACHCLSWRRSLCSPSRAEMLVSLHGLSGVAAAIMNRCHEPLELQHCRSVCPCTFTHAPTHEHSYCRTRHCRRCGVLCVRMFLLTQIPRRTRGFHLLSFITRRTFVSSYTRAPLRPPPVRSVN